MRLHKRLENRWLWLQQSLNRTIDLELIGAFFHAG